jgi:RNA polymerase sigma-70 factor (ECF subfamily)
MTGMVMSTINEATFSSRPFNSQCYSAATATDRSDDALIGAIVRGDRHAMRLLFGRHSVTVYRFALRIVANEAAAEDVVSEVFADVWRKAAAFEGRSKVSTWLLAITRHKALEIVRRRTPEALDDDAYNAVEDEADNPETAMHKKQCHSIVQRCLKDLSPCHREIIDLVQKSIGEIAKIIHAPCSTVKTRMFYARSQLTKRLAES